MPLPLLVLQQVTAWYPDQPIFEELDLAIVSGQFAAIVGPTGGRKPTLLKTILGVLPCLSGRIHWARSSTIDYVSQRESIDWAFPVTTQQVVLMGRHRQTTEPFGVPHDPLPEERTPYSAALGWTNALRRPLLLCVTELRGITGG
ncbi:MAG: ATP-binding cassette domain-containing protein [Candidatus Entotheonellia bacterium]